MRSPLNPDEARIGELWLRQGLAEHASIAAFARFQLHLIQLGAPPELLEQTVHAMADEVKHARMCFTLAERFRGRSAGPGPLDTSGALSGDALTIIEAAVAEGCVNETVSVEYCREALARCGDAEVRAVLGQIVTDEDRHVELAWGFINWALDKYPEFRRPAIVAIRSEVRQDFGEAPRGHEPPEMERYGILRASTEADVRRRAIHDVVVPRVQAAFGQDVLCDLV